MSTTLSKQLTPDDVLRAAKKCEWRYSDTCRELGYKNDTPQLRRVVMRWGYRNWIDYRIKQGGPADMPARHEFQTVWEGGERDLVRLAEKHNWNLTHMGKAIGCSPDVFHKRFKKLGYRSWADFKEKHGERPKLTLQRIWECVQKVGDDGYASARHVSLKLGYGGNPGAIVSYVKRNGWDSWPDFLTYYQPEPITDEHGQVVMDLEGGEDDQLLEMAKQCGWQIDLVCWKLGYDDRQPLIERLHGLGYTDWADYYTRMKGAVKT